MAFLQYHSMDHPGLWADSAQGYLYDLTEPFDTIREVELAFLGSYKTTDWNAGFGSPEDAGFPHFSIQHSVLGDTNLALAANWFRDQIGIAAFNWNIVTPNDPRMTPIGPAAKMELDCAIGRETALSLLAPIEALYEGIYFELVVISGKQYCKWTQSPREYSRINPGRTYYPYPANESIEVPQIVTLTWDQFGNAVSYDVYFGTDPTPDSGEFIGNQAGKTYTPAPLLVDTDYYWRIDSVNLIDTTPGPVWTFHTIA